jgi:hypothetical protein
LHFSPNNLDPPRNRISPFTCHHIFFHYSSLRHRLSPFFWWFSRRYFFFFFSRKEFVTKKKTIPRSAHRLKRKKIAFSNLERKMRSQRTKPLEKLHRSVLPVENTRELHDANLSTHHPVIDSPAIRRRRSMHTSHKSGRKSSSTTTLKEKPQKETPAQGKQRREREKKKLFCCKTFEYRSKEQIY